MQEKSSEIRNQSQPSGCRGLNSGTDTLLASQVALGEKDPPPNVEEIRDMGSIPGSGRSPGDGHGNPLQCSCLENPMDRRAWWAIIHRVTESDMTEAAEHACMHPPTV